MFQAWLVKMANTAANSAPSTRPGASDMKNTTVTEMKPEDGNRLQNVEERHQHELGPAALGGPGRVGEA